MSRESVLYRVRTALGRVTGQEPPALPAPLLNAPSGDSETRIAHFISAFEYLAGKAFRVPDRAAARQCVEDLLAGGSAVVSNAPFLAECGIQSSGIQDVDALRHACAEATAGITSADYALSATGTLVLLASAREARMISLLPPLHIAVIPASVILADLDELLTILPKPAQDTSSMVMITGPSRTADIEQILVRGVHGPGEVRVVIVEHA